jgi:hypothetical protein
MTSKPKSDLELHNCVYNFTSSYELTTHKSVLEAPKRTRTIISTYITEQTE